MICHAYAEQLAKLLTSIKWDGVEILCKAIFQCWLSKKQVFIFGNGGSAANAQHIANDLLSAAYMHSRAGIKTHALTANQAVTSCFGNDLGFEHIFSKQLSVLGEPGDLCLALSGSGNSPNILNALSTAREKGMQTFALLGYSGGKAIYLAEQSIHINTSSMQFAEDCQLIVGHMLMLQLGKYWKEYFAARDEKPSLSF